MFTGLIEEIGTLKGIRRSGHRTGSLCDCEILKDDPGITADTGNAQLMRSRERFLIIRNNIISVRRQRFTSQRNARHALGFFCPVINRRGTQNNNRPGNRGLTAALFDVPRTRDLIEQVNAASINLCELAPGYQTFNRFLIAGQTGKLSIFLFAIEKSADQFPNHFSVLLF